MLDSASLFGWPHQLSFESSFLAKAVAGGEKKGKQYKKERPALWLSASGGAWRQRGVNRPQPRRTQCGKTKTACQESDSCWLHLFLPLSHSLCINVQWGRSLDTRFKAQQLPSSYWSTQSGVRRNEKMKVATVVGYFQYIFYDWLQNSLKHNQHCKILLGAYIVNMFDDQIFIRHCNSIKPIKIILI